MAIKFQFQIIASNSYKYKNIELLEYLLSNFLILMNVFQNFVSHVEPQIIKTSKRYVNWWNILSHKYTLFFTIYMLEHGHILRVFFLRVYTCQRMLENSFYLISGDAKYVFFMSFYFFLSMYQYKFFSTNNETISGFFLLLESRLLSHFFPRCSLSFLDYFPSVGFLEPLCAILQFCDFFLSVILLP